MRTNRKYCIECNKAQSACICSFVENVENLIPITILRHSSEKGKEKATADLISKSLSNCRIIDGETFKADEVLMSEHINLLVYPNNDSEVIVNNSSHDHKNIHLIFIDGTWKKAYKIYQVNSFLHELKSVELELQTESPYSEIRKQRKHGLSTYEAVYETLAIYEPAIRNSNLEENFNSFLQFLKSFRN
jgi:DTW domain-containing protein YfiP